RGVSPRRRPSKEGESGRRLRNPGTAAGRPDPTELTSESVLEGGGRLEAHPDHHLPPSHKHASFDAGPGGKFPNPAKRVPPADRAVGTVLATGSRARYTNCSVGIPACDGPGGASRRPRLLLEGARAVPGAVWSSASRAGHHPETAVWQEADRKSV